MLAIAGCSSGPPVEKCGGAQIQVMEANSFDSTSKNGSCEGADSIGVSYGTVAAGGQCGAPTDCAPTCCDCTNGKSALIAWCDHGICATADRTCCALAGTPTNSCGRL